MDLRSHYPYWLMKNGIVASYPSLQKNITVDVAIVGAGISGALIAYYLSKAGISIAVIDRRHAGMGSTAASTALLQYEIDTPLYKLVDYVGLNNAVKSYKLCLKAIYDLQEICRKLNPDLSFNIKPSLQYATYAKHYPALYREYGMRRKYGFNVNWLEPDDVEKKFGIKTHGALLSEEAGEIDAYLVTHTLLRHCIAQGHTICDNTDIIKIENEPTHVSLYSDTGNIVNAKKLVLACGYETLQYIPKDIAKLYSTYAFVSEPIDEEKVWYERSLIWETNTPYMYFRITDDNRVLVGGKDDPFYDPHLRDARVKKKAKLLQDAFSQKFTNIPIRIDFNWAGTFASTEDGLPYIGTIPQKPNTYFALGFGGNGITFSVIAAQMIRDMLLGKKNENTNIFSFDR